MPGVQGPPVVFLHKIPLLRREVSFDRIVLHVTNRAANVLRRIEEDFPTGPTPDGMVVGAETERAKPQTAGNLKLRNHLLSEVLVLADHEVDVVRHDGAGV